jgi:hypothetical protein
MGDRRPKKRAKPPAPDEPAGADVFAAFGLAAADFEVETGGGKSFLSGQRIVWMTVRHRATGRIVSGKIGTTKRDAERQHDELLRTLLGSFQRS